MSKKKSAPDATKAIAYVQCSTDRQDLSPDTQRDAISEWADREGIDVVAWHEDRGVSGGAEIEQRPGLTAAVADLAPRNAGLLVVARRDRLARDVLTAAPVERLCEQAGARVVSADGIGSGDTPKAALLRSMIDAFAAYERALKRSRTKAALAVKKARGERVGGSIPDGADTPRGTRHERPEVSMGALRVRRAPRPVAATFAALRCVPRWLAEVAGGGHGGLGAGETGVARASITAQGNSIPYAF